jgi:hypothetical protein
MFDWLRKLFKRKATEQLLGYDENKPFFHPDNQRAFNEGVNKVRKELKQQRIAKLNEERRKATLGYGLNSRNFKPRPAFEKKLWDLSAKPEKENA